MIKLVESFEEIAEYTKIDVFSVRIFSLAKAYGFNYDFSNFWLQKSELTSTAIIGKLDNNVTISYNESANLDELKDFLSLLGYVTLTCTDDFEIECGFESGVVMENHDSSNVPLLTDVSIEPAPLGDVFRLNKNFLTSVDYNEFYADMSHKIRHGTARFCGVKTNNEFVSCGGVVSIHGNNAILSFVATDENFRNRGFGSAVVASLLQDRVGHCFLLRDSQKNELFYKKLGFKNTEKWRMYKNDPFF